MTETGRIEMTQQAFGMLREYADNSNLPPGDAARGLVGGTLVPAQLVRPSPGQP